MFGYREDDRKFLFNASTDAIEIYDLATDPFERSSKVEPKLAVVARQRLAAWVQYQAAMMQRLGGQ